MKGTAEKFPELNSERNKLLLVRNLSVFFDGFVALNQLDFSIDACELKCLIGPNGAGKTTLLDVLTGRVKPNQGSAMFRQQINLPDKTESEISQLGISRKFQKPSVFEEQSVFANLELAISSKKNIFGRIFTKLSSLDFDRILVIGETISLSSKLGKPAGTLSHGEKQWLEMVCF